MIKIKDKIVNSLSNNALLAFRVLVATALAMFICYSLGVDTNIQSLKIRIYWTVFGVIGVSAVNINTNIIFDRAKSLIVFSVIGSLFASALLYIISENIYHSHILILILCALSLIIYIYVLSLDYASSVFFIHCFLVMFFGLFEQWNIGLFFTRIFCIFVGSSSIVFVTLLTRANKNKKALINKLDTIFIKITKIIEINCQKKLNFKVFSLIDESHDFKDLLISSKHDFKNKEIHNLFANIILEIDEIIISLKTFDVLLNNQKSHSKNVDKDINEYFYKKLQRDFKNLKQKYIEIKKLLP